MQNTLKVSLYSAAAAIVVVGALLFGISNSAHAQPSSINVQSTAAATTTLTFLGNGTATSTYQIDSYPTYSSSKVFSMAGIDSVYLDLEGVASSSATVFGINVQVSNNGIDWYSVATTTLAQTSFAIPNLASSTTFVWQPNMAATSSMEVKLPDVAAIHERVQFSATGAAGAVYAEVVLKKNAQGQ